MLLYRDEGGVVISRDGVGYFAGDGVGWVILLSQKYL